MSLFGNLLINFYFLSVLFVISYHTHKNPNRASVEFKLYKLMVDTTFLLLILDSLGRFDGYPDTVYPLLNRVGNFLLFSAFPLLSSLWLMYVNYQIYHDRKSLLKTFRWIIAVDLANVALVIAQLPLGIIYTIDSQNIYHRGPGFFIPTVLAFLYFILAWAMIAVNRKKIEPAHFRALTLFPIPPLIAIIIQFFVYGVSLMFGGVSISLLIVYLYIQNQNLNTDFLTGASNRIRLETYLHSRIKNLYGAFSVIMVDIDNFKKINDSFGHDVGDEALEEAVRLIKGTLRARDFITRYGGDEFYIVLDGVDNLHDLETVVKKLRENIDRYNQSSDKPYKMQFSMGYAVYDSNSGMDMDAFLKHVDTLMYEDKRRKLENEQVITNSL